MSRPTGPRNPSPLAGSPKPLSTSRGLIRPAPASGQSWCGGGYRTQKGRPGQGGEGHPGPELTILALSQVWFQNRRSKERRMKQLSALGARRHAFFRSPRRMRPLGGRLDESEMLGSTPYTYYGGKDPPKPRTPCPTLGPVWFGGLRTQAEAPAVGRPGSPPSFLPAGKVHNHEHTLTDTQQQGRERSAIDTSWTQNQTHGFTHPYG